MSHLIIEPLSKLLYGIAHPVQSVNILKYKKANKNASDIDLYDLPLNECFKIATNDDELNLWNKFSAMIDYTFPMQKLQKTTANDKIWSELKYCMTFATYAYFMPIIGIPDPKHKEFGITIKDKDIPAIGPKTRTIANPGYFIGIDDKRKIILLCIRGTMTIGDTITDLHAIPDRLSFGVDQDEKGPFYHCHPGMFNAANYLHKTVNVTGKIKQYLAKKGREDYKVFVTGHSLGAGVTSMLGLLWKTQNVFPDDKFKCFSFASPLVIGKDGVNKSLSNDNINMISVAVESDIVTRLSVKGLIQLSKRVELIRKNKDGYNQLFDKIKASKIKTNKITKAGLDSLSPLLNVLDDTKEDEIADLYPAGRVLWFVPDCVANNNNNNNKHKNSHQQLLDIVELQTSPFSSFRLIQLLYDMICAFYVVDNNETLCEYKDINDRMEFTQMVMHGDESFHAHSQGRYTNGFGVDLIDIFRLSQAYQRLERLKIPTTIIDIFLFIIIIVVFCVLRVIGFIGDVIDLIF